MPVTTRRGDLFTASEQIIAHQVNGLGIMGQGVAKQVRRRHPDIYEAYKTFIESSDANQPLLGKNLMLTTDGSRLFDFPKRSAPDAKIIANLFSQAHRDKDRDQTDTEAFRKALEHLKDYAKTYNLSVALPYGIGTGRGRGNWNEIYGIIASVFNDYPVTLYRDSNKR